MLLRALLVLIAAIVFHGNGHTASRWCRAPLQVEPEASGRIIAAASAATKDRPQAVSHLQIEGRLPSSDAAARSKEARRDFDKVLTLAHAWRLNGSDDFARAARGLLVAWARTYRSEANPIDEAPLPRLIEGYALLRDNIDGDDRIVIDSWLQSIRQGHVAKLRASKMIDNWRSHRIHIAAAIAFALEDDAALAEMRGQFRTQVLRSIGRDGTTVDFRKRNAIHYTVYTLEPLVRTALLLALTLAPTEEDAEVRARLMAGLDWLVPYAQGERVHREFDPPRTAIDRRRASAGVPGFSGPWSPVGASDLFWLAAYLDGKYLPVARRLVSEPPDLLVACRGQPVQRSPTQR